MKYGKPSRMLLLVTQRNSCQFIIFVKNMQKQQQQKCLDVIFFLEVLSLMTLINYIICLMKYFQNLYLSDNLYFEYFLLNHQLFIFSGSKSSRQTRQDSTALCLHE
jgi:hypothetical protein